jgi:hypothetical protein
MEEYSSKGKGSNGNESKEKAHLEDGPSLLGADLRIAGWGG